jgi:3-hydroxybutyryl-CoA dehydrogenase
MMSAMSQVRISQELASLAPAPIWLEAVPEDLELKQRTFRRIAELAAPHSLLATNTSTLSVGDIASVVEHPERVVGLHFFNPAAVLPLVEVVHTEYSEPNYVKAATEFARRLGKTPVRVKDSPGFIVNRVARPFYGEALRILGETGTEVETIDEIVESAGFSMGPFRLMDLIGVDINLAATTSMFAQTGGNERHRPHPIQERMVERGRLGRKVGEGFYEYGETETFEESYPLPKEANVQRAFVIDGSLAGGLREYLKAAGLQITRDPNVAEVAMVLRDRSQDALSSVRQLDSRLADGVPLFCQTATMSLRQLLEAGVSPSRLIGMDSIFIGEGDRVTLQFMPGLEQEVQDLAESVMAQLGLRACWIEDSPALILPRLVGMIVNEAAFAVEEGVAEAEVVDKAMELGVNYPKGPLGWGAEIGWPQIVSVLEHLQEATGETRYTPANLLRHWAQATTHGR